MDPVNIGMILQGLSGKDYPLYIGLAVGYVFLAAVLWKMFEKEGIAPWKALIPVLNIIYLFQVLSDSDTFWGMLLTGVLVLGLMYIINSSTTGTETKGLVKNLLLIVGVVICFGFHVFNSFKGAERFGKSEGFAVGMIMLPIIFYPVLAFGKSEYHVY